MRCLVESAVLALLAAVLLAAPDSAVASSEKAAGGSLVSLLSSRPDHAEDTGRSLSERSVTIRVRGTEMETVTPDGSVIMGRLPEPAEPSEHAPVSWIYFGSDEQLLSYIRQQRLY